MKYLERDDICQITSAEPEGRGYYKLDAWPDPAGALVRIAYDPRIIDGEGVKRAIIEPYYDKAERRWSLSPFRIEGYTPRTLPWRPGTFGSD